MPTPGCRVSGEDECREHDRQQDCDQDHAARGSGAWLEGGSKQSWPGLLEGARAIFS